MASRALSEPRDPHRPGPWGKQKCGPNRTLTLTDAGRETVREYRAARLEAERGVTVLGWVDVPAAWLDTGPSIPSTYYTPPAILAIIEPQIGSGAFLAELAQNPPWGES